MNKKVLANEIINLRMYMYYTYILYYTLIECFYKLKYF